MTKIFKTIKFFVFTFLLLSSLIRPAYSVVDPRLSPNNKVGVGLLSPESEISEAAKLVNHGGDWGWTTIIIKKNERNVDRWQSVFHLLSKHHLIPIVRLATDVDEYGNWQRPTDEDAKAWADFLDKLYWPTKNRYVQVYNEVNRAAEWGGIVDASDYAKELNKTIGALKERNDDFFVLNAPLDLALNNGNGSLDASFFYSTMESTVPGIFKKLDGWASHSYPNPNFSASPFKLGRTGIDGYRWEIEQISQYLDGRSLPVFITETGWKRADLNFDGLTEEVIAQYFEIAFRDVWSDENVIAVTPFIFDYQEPLFSPFSFRTKGRSDEEQYYDYYFTIRNLPKTRGDPKREDLISGIQINFPDVLIKDREKEVSVVFSNIGNYIWDTKDGLRLETELPESVVTSGLEWNQREIFPGQKAIGTFKITVDELGKFSVKIRIFDKENQLDEKQIVVRGETYFSLLFNIVGGLLD